jgi:hypothetical protein
MAAQQAVDEILPIVQPKKTRRTVANAFLFYPRKEKLFVNVNYLTLLDRFLNDAA